MALTETITPFPQDQVDEILSLTPLGDHVAIQGSTIRFRDLITKEVLQPGEVPPAVRLHPTIGQGIRYLEHRGRRGDLRVNFLLAPHGEPDDFYHMAETYPQAFDSPMFAIEANWISDSPKPNPLPQQAQVHFAQNHESRRSFQEAQVNWLQDHDKIIMPSDMRFNDPSLLSEKLATLWDEVVIPIQTDKRLNARQQKVASTIAERVYQSTRQWGIMGQLGQWLLALDKENQLCYGDPVPIMLGSWHKPSVKRLDGIGIHARAFHSRRKTQLDTPEYEAYGDVVTKAMYAYAITLEQLAVPRPY